MAVAQDQDPNDERHRKAFAAAYALHYHRVLQWSRRWGDAGEAEDLAQDVFARLWVELPSLEARGDLGGWLHEVTTNLAISHRRRRATFTQRVARLLLGEAAEAHRAEPVEALDAGWARAALQALPELEQLALSRKYLEDLEQREIARALGRSDGYVSKLVAGGLTRLRALAAGAALDTALPG